ncbi:hypothetical protein LVK59_28730, partial [Escherichia coli]|nr:hypothetical protein [Escherichia coli]
IKESIRAFESPPLSPITIARKGFDKPLIDTGDMQKSVSYEVSVTNGAIVIHTQRLKSDPGGNLLS